MPTADRRRQDLHLQDPRGGQVPRRLAADRGRRGGELERRSSSRPKGVLSPRESHYMMVDKVEAPDPTTVVFHLKFATNAFLPALADPFSFIYQKAILDKDPHWYEKNILGLGPVQVRRATRSASRSRGCATPTIITRGCPISTASPAIYADKQAVRVDAHPQRPRGDRVPRLSADGPRRAGRRARRQDRGAEQRLELRQLSSNPTTRKNRSTMSACAAR